MTARIHVAALHGPTQAPEFVTLSVQYDGKEVQIRLPVGEPLYDQEPGVDVYRRQLQELMTVLEEWEKSHSAILWPHPLKK